MTTVVFWFLLLSLIAFAVIAAVQTIRLRGAQRDAYQWRTLAAGYRAARNADRIIR